MLPISSHAAAVPNQQVVLRIFRKPASLGPGRCGFNVLGGLPLQGSAPISGRDSIVMDPLAWVKTAGLLFTAWQESRALPGWGFSGLFQPRLRIIPCLLFCK